MTSFVKKSFIIRLTAFILLIIFGHNLSGQGLRVYKTDGSIILLPYENIDSIVGYDIPVISTEYPSVDFSGEELKKNLQIKTNTEWRISNKPEWVSITPQKGFGNTIIMVTVKEHFGETRTATITLVSADGTSNLSILLTQYGKDPEFVDLGLSVKWATINIGSEKPEDFGNYYAWGETSTKKSYKWSSYKYSDGSNTSLTKYNNNSSYGKVDKLKILEPDDDVACLLWGEKWRMPTKEEQDELRQKCSWVWSKINGVEGYVVTSKIDGYKDRSIFLPAAGDMEDMTLNNVGTHGCYWSKTVCTDDNRRAYTLPFNSTHPYTGQPDRFRGYNIRPVRP